MRSYPLRSSGVEEPQPSILAIGPGRLGELKIFGSAAFGPLCSHGRRVLYVSAHGVILESKSWYSLRGCLRT